MREEIERRARTCGAYIVETGATVRACAEHFGVSKSTVHKDVTVRLALCDEPLCEDVRRVLGINLRERHLRGGDATRRKYLAAGEGKCVHPPDRPAPQHGNMA